MGMSFQFLNRTVASLLAVALFSTVSWAADQEKLDRLYGQLQDADPAGARRVARDIEMEWSKSGSPAMDLLLKRGTDALEAGGAVKAPMPGKVLSVPVKAGDSVKKGQTLAVLEAMKMEHALSAPRDGVVESVDAAEGDQVGDGAILVTLTDE